MQLASIWAYRDSLPNFVIMYSLPSHPMTFFLLWNTKGFWRMFLNTSIFIHTMKVSEVPNNFGPYWLQLYIDKNTSSFVFIQVWNDMRACKCWPYFIFFVNYPFKISECLLHSICLFKLMSIWDLKYEWVLLERAAHWILGRLRTLI